MGGTPPLAKGVAAAGDHFDQKVPETVFPLDVSNGRRSRIFITLYYTSFVMYEVDFMEMLSQGFYPF